MTGQVIQQYPSVPQQSPGAPDVRALDDRLRRLEDRVAALAEAVRVLAHGLDDLPAAGPGGNQAAIAARRAHELLLASGPTREPAREPAS